MEGFSATSKAQRFFAACAARDPEDTPVVPFYRSLYETGCRCGFKAAPRCGFLPAQVAGKEPPDYQTSSPRLPDFQLEVAIVADEFEVGAVGRDEARAVCADGESDQDIEVKLAELVRLEALVGVDFREEPAGFEPVFFCRREKGMALFKSLDYMPIHGC